MAMVAESGWESLTMASLGARAGVSRQSVYNEVGTKADLAEALVAQELATFLAAVAEELAGAADLGSGVRAATLRVYRMAEDNPLLREIVSTAHGAGQGLLPLLTTQAQPLIGAAAAAVAHGIESDFPLPVHARAQLGEASDTVVRLVLSNIMQPGGSPEEMADSAAWVAVRLLG